MVLLIIYLEEGIIRIIPSEMASDPYPLSIHHSLSLAVPGYLFSR